MTLLDRLIDHHSSAMQRAFATGNGSAARWHCGQFSEYARRRAQPLFNDGNGGTRPAAPQPAGAPSPNHVEDGAGKAR